MLPHPAMKVILEEYLISVQLASERIARCEAAMSDLLGKWRLESAVRALMAMKGFQSVAAMIVVSELGALARFTHPRQVMAYLAWCRAKSLPVTGAVRERSPNAAMLMPAGYW